MMSTLLQLKLVLVLGGMFILPGWAFLAASGLWRRWPGLQSWILAVSGSIAFYPILFYITRFVWPSFSLGSYKLLVILLFCLGVIVFRMRGCWRACFSFDDLEWVAMFILGMVLFTRLWVIRDHPYPAWSDSLHHTLLTQLTAAQGRLPLTMEPYVPVPMDRYHLGLYALSGTAQNLAGVPEHTALLWVSQVLNGVCGLGVYLVLDRKVGRVGALVGAATVGLFSHHPAFYVNWGRFTQIAGQTLLLSAWLVSWEAIRTFAVSRGEAPQSRLWLMGLAAALSGGVFLLHFRVAIFYAPLLAWVVLWEMWRAYQARHLSSVLLALFVLGGVTLLVISPVLWDAVQVYVRTAVQEQVPPEYQTALQNFYIFPLRSWPDLIARPWLLVAGIVGLLVGLLRCNKFVGLLFLWTLSLFALGYSYVLNIPLLNVTNFGAVAIMLYLPLGLIIGTACDEMWCYCSAHWPSAFTKFKPLLMLFLCFSVLSSATSGSQTLNLIVIS